MADEAAEQPADDEGPAPPVLAGPPKAAPKRSKPTRPPSLAQGGAAAALAGANKLKQKSARPARPQAQRVYQGNDDSVCVVLVQTASHMYAGLSADVDRNVEEHPRVIVPNVFGYSLNFDEASGKQREEMFFHEAYEQRNSLQLIFPIRHGIVQDWEVLEKVWQRLFLNPKLELDVVKRPKMVYREHRAVYKSFDETEPGPAVSDPNGATTNTGAGPPTATGKKKKNKGSKDTASSVGDNKSEIGGDKDKDPGINPAEEEEEELFDHPLLNRFPILITEAPWTSKLDRERMVGVLFDKFDAIAVCVTQIPTLTLVAHGKKTGCLVDIGETTTSACCIYEGYLMPHTVDRNNYGGKDITELLLKFLKEERDIEFFGEEWRQLQNAEEILHKMGFVLTNGMTELKLCQPKNYECKLTGRVYSIKTERCRCLEALFKPQMFEQLRGINLGGKTLLTKEEQAYLQTLNSFQPSGSEEEVGGALKTTASLQELTCHAINCSNHPIRPELFMNIVLAGGVSRVTNLAQRLRQELRDMPFLKAMMNSCLGDEDDYLALQHRKRKTTKNDALTSSMESMDELTKMLELEEEEQRQFRRTGRIKLSNPLEYLKFDIIVHDPLDLRDLIPAKRADHMNHGDEISKSAADAVRGTGAAAKKPTFRIPGLMTEKERKEKEVKNRNSDGRGATTTAIPQFEPMIKPNEVYLGAANLASMDMFELLHFKREEYESGLTGVGGITGVHKKVV